MAAWLLVLGVVVAVALVLGSAISLFLALRQPDSLEELGVKPTYPVDPLPEERIEAYREAKEKLREQHAQDSEDDVWMSSLPGQAKDMLKYRLMQRAIGDMSSLRKIDADARGYWKLFSKGIVSSKFWNSVLAAEKQLSQEIESVKAEAFSIEPTHDPQGIVSEAMQFVIRYGDKITHNEVPSADAAGAAAPSAEALGAAAKALAGMPGMPRLPGGPGSLPMPPGMPMGGPPGPPGDPRAPQQGGTTEGYTWRQDTEEVEISVTLPADATKAEVKVQIQLKTLRVEHCGKALVEGQLAAPCSPDGSTWTLSKGRIVVTLEKKDPRPWTSLFALKA
mmetsp:Transcript_23837/g.42614  ORF Transcript_23837/g.42614 Transcript_23837/m.42614 type:complete len:335 (+) Transcript_23837:120-1124(+)